MNKPANPDQAAWVQEHVDRFMHVVGQYQALAGVLLQFLGAAAKKLAPQAILQARAKSVPSFVEKIVRKRGSYRDPLADMTDLCGARVIVHTAEEVHAFAAFIKQHFAVDWDNSPDVSQRLQPTEFGYRSDHYVIALRPGPVQLGATRIEIPAELSGALPAELFPAGDMPHAYKAEIQVRTVLEHAWADIAHDIAYKSGFKVPERIRREFAALSAVLEGCDREFSRVLAQVGAYTSDYGRYLAPEEIHAEIAKLELVLKHDPRNGDMAARLGALAIAVDDWQKAVAVLEPFRDSDYPAARRRLGVAECRLKRAQGDQPGFFAAREFLERVLQPPHNDPEGLAALAAMWRDEDEDRARVLYRQAFEADPTHPTCLSNYLEHEIAYQRNGAILTPAAPTIEAACRRCRAHIEGEVNLPWAYLHLAQFHLLLGQPEESLTALAKAIEHATSPTILDTMLATLKRLKPIADRLPGFECVRRLTLLGQHVKFPSPAIRAAIHALATPNHPPLAEPVVLVAGGCDATVEQQMQTYRQLLVDAFAAFRGTVISGGTRQGIGGLVGDVRQTLGCQLRTVSYLPKNVPSDATVDRDSQRYDELRPTEGTGFSALESLQTWIDLVASDVAPSNVKLVGINGGKISAVEYRVAATLGAQVAVIEKSGREAARILTDPEWKNAANLVALPTDAMTLRAFLAGGKEKLPEEQCQTIARAIHEAYCRKRPPAPRDPSLVEWNDLSETLRLSNLHQAQDVLDKLRAIGCRIEPLPPGAQPTFQFTPQEIEHLAEIEHGRFNAERILQGWRLGATKDVAKKISPFLVPYAELPEEVKQWDRDAVSEIPALLAQVGLQVVRG